MIRTNLGQVRQSNLPIAIGLCRTDIPQIAAAVNEAQQRLINAGGESGFVGGWAKVVFAVSRCNPFITLPRQFQRIINLDVCRTPIRIQNEFYEMLFAGVGQQGFNHCLDWCGSLQGYERGVFPTTVDLPTSNQLIRVYLTDSRDTGKRILIGPAKDANGNYIYSQDGVNSVNGFYLVLGSPFTTSSMIVTDIGGITKDATFGDVLLYAVDATSGAQTLLSRYAPDEITPSYRRYYFNNLPCNCAPVAVQSPCIAPQPVPTTVAITAMAKLEFIPVQRDTDFLVIGNIPALKHECMAIRYGTMDTEEAARLEAKNHAIAIKLLNDELRAYLGELQPAVNVAPWGTAHLNRPMRAVMNG